MSLLKVGHIGLNVSDLERSSSFYKDVLGFIARGESSDNDRKYAFLGTDKEVILTLWQQSQGSFSAVTPGLHHLAFEGSQSGGIYFEDPDGIRHEIFTASGAQEHGQAAPNGPSCGFF